MYENLRLLPHAFWEPTGLYWWDVRLLLLLFIVSVLLPILLLLILVPLTPI